MSYSIFKGFTPTAREREMMEFYTTSGLYEAVVERIQSISDQLFDTSFLYYCDYKSVNEIIKKFELFILDIRDSKISKKSFVSRMWSLRDLIYQNKWFKEFNYLFYLVYSRVYTDKYRAEIYIEIVSMLLELAMYVYGKYIPCYCDSDGNVIVDEGNEDYFNEADYELRKRVIANPDEGLTSFDDHEHVFSAESRFRSRLILSVFLKETDRAFWSASLEGARHILVGCEMWESVEFMRANIEERTKILPRRGITLQLNDFGNFSHIVLKEKMYTSGEVVLLFMLYNNKDTCMTGFYNLSTKVFYCCISDSKAVVINQKADLYCDRVENLVLQLYMFLTTDVVPKRNRLKAIKIFNSMSDYNSSHCVSQINAVIQGDVTFDGDASDSEIPSSRRRGDYIEVMREIEPYFRRLPDGWSASEEARSNAKRYGYKLPPDKTFVTGFDKKVLVKQK